MNLPEYIQACKNLDNTVNTYVIRISIEYQHIHGKDHTATWVHDFYDYMKTKSIVITTTENSNTSNLVIEEGVEVNDIVNDKRESMDYIFIMDQRDLLYMYDNILNNNSTTNEGGNNDTLRIILHESVVWNYNGNKFPRFRINLINGNSILIRVLNQYVIDLTNELQHYRTYSLNNKNRIEYISKLLPKLRSIMLDEA